MPEHSTHLERELVSQPDVWESVVGQLDGVRSLLPTPGERVAVIGCGTSWFMGQAYAERREQLGQGITDAFAASEYHLDRGYDRAVAICRSGTTTEVLAVLDTLAALGTPHTSIVATSGTPVAERSDRTILLSEADEQSVVQTRFATSNLALLRASLGDDLAPAIADARRVLDEDPAVSTAAFDRADQTSFLGTGWTTGLADEVARVRPVLVRVLPRDGVLARADEHRHDGPRGPGPRRGPGRACRRRRGDRRPLRAPGDRPAGRAGPGASLLQSTCRRSRGRPRPAASPHPQHRARLIGAA